MTFIIQDPYACYKHCWLSNAPRRWAWHNAHITKRIAKEQRITIPIKNRKPLKTGGSRKRPARPRTSLKEKISNLHLLLRVPSFSRWPLEVRFFCNDVYQVWQYLNERVDGSIRGGIKVLLDLEQLGEIINIGELPVSTQAKVKRKREALGKGGIGGLNVGYSELKSHIEKSIFFLAEDEAIKCAVCAKDLGPKTAMALSCPQENCRTASHMTCLATKFIEDEGAGAAVMPISGKCLGCKGELQWIDLMKELSLRLRGEKEVVQMMKKPKVPKTKNAAASRIEAHTVVEKDVDDPDEDLVDLRALDASDDSLPNDWQYQDDDGDGIMSVISGHSASSDGVEAANLTKRPSIAPKLPAVIEDSS